MKRWFSFGVLLFSLVFLLLSATRGQESKHYAQLLIDNAKLEQLKTSRKETDRGLLGKITFNHYPLFQDKLTSGWFYSIDPEKPDTNPEVSFEQAAQSVKIVFSGEIKPGETIPFIAYTDTEYKSYSLVVTTLPLIRIECPDSDYLIGMDLSDVHPVRFTLFDNRSETLYPFVQSDGTIHIRGEISRFFEKKNFRLHLTQKSVGKGILENPIPLLGLRKDGDWVLYSAYNDQEKIRNVFTSNLWMYSCADDNSFGLKNGMEYRFTEMFWNDSYCGLYALGYPIDPEQMGIQVDSMGHYEEFLFKQKHWGPKTEGPDPEYDGLILQQNDASQSDLNNGIGITKMYFALLESGAPGGLWYNDEKNVLDIWLFIKLVQGSDQVSSEFPGKLRNMYLTIKKAETGTKILYTPWDLDMSWGNIINTFHPYAINYTLPYLLSAEDNSYEMTVNPVSVLREKDPAIVIMLKNRYAELRSSGWSDQAIDAMIDGFEKVIYDSGAYRRETIRWPEGTYQDEALKLSVFRKYVHQRLKAMDNYIENLSVGQP